jgi:hypothetical protein
MVGYDRRKIAQNRKGVKRDFGLPVGTLFQAQDRKEPQYVGGDTDLPKLAITLYIKLGVRQTIKGDIEKIYLVCYPIFEKKETSCKEIV